MPSLFDKSQDKKIEPSDKTQVLWIYTEYIMSPDGTLRQGKHMSGVKGVKSTKQLKAQLPSMPKMVVEEGTYYND